MRPESGHRRKIISYLYKHIPHISLILALFVLGTILCFRYPEYLTTPGVRSSYPLELFRALITYFMWASMILAVVSIVFLRKAGAPIIALSLLFIGYLYGGSQVYHPAEYESFAVRIGLDVFMLDLFLLAVIFIPLESFFPMRKDQSLIRPEFGTDLLYFGVSHLGIQAIALVTSMPAENFVREYAGGVFLARLPLGVQIILGLLVADFVQYWVHRSFHTGFLWRFHRVHHSIEHLDWLAGSRLHLMDIFLTRFSVYTVLFLSFSSEALVYIILVIAFQATWIHSNTRWSPHWLEIIIVTPRIHHWHHADNKRAYDTNFAIQFSFIDRMFGTYRAPKAHWPEKCGVEGPVPEGYLKQLVWPLQSFLNYVACAAQKDAKG